MSNEDRRPNPPGWTPPKAPYNPYDPTDNRPAEGYPSEFSAPGKKRSWSIRPKEPENYRVVKDQLKRLQYTPRPLSDLYPGQYKVLRRTGSGAFNAGIRYTSFILGSGLIFFGVFFYRWNDGYENIFSIPHRFQLKLRERLFGELHGVAKEDLYSPKSRGMSRSGSSELPSSPAHTISESIGSFGEDGNHLDKEPGKVLDRSDELHLITGSNEDDGVTLQRPQRMHFIEAERIRQQREEAILRAVDIAEEQLKLKNGRQSEVQSTLGDEKKPGGSRWKFW